MQNRRKSALERLLGADKPDTGIMSYDAPEPIQMVNEDSRFDQLGKGGPIGTTEAPAFPVRPPVMDDTISPERQARRDKAKEVLGTIGRGALKGITDPETLATITMPLLGMIESIATKGQGKGFQSGQQGILAGMQMGEQIKDNKLKRTEREENARQSALKRELLTQIGTKKITEDGMDPRDMTPEELEAAYEQYMLLQDPTDYVRYMLGRGKGENKPFTQSELDLINTSSIIPINQRDIIYSLAQTDPAAARKLYASYGKMPEKPFEQRMAEAMELQRGKNELAELYKEPNATQNQYADFAMRMDLALPVIDKLENDKEFNPTSLLSVFSAQGITDDLINSFRDPKQKQYAQAKRSFINAVLRRESGAAISGSEFDSANKQYFPQFGDDPETIKQKADLRNSVLSRYRAAAGKAYTPAPPAISTINSQAEYEQLPSGARYRFQGKEYTKE